MGNSGASSEENTALSKAARWQRTRLALLCWVAVVGCGGGVYVCYRLGIGRLAPYEYQCTLLGIWLFIAGLLGVCLARYFQPMEEKRVRRISGLAGPLVFFLIFLGLYGMAQGVYWKLNRNRAETIERIGSHSRGDSYRFDRVLGYGPRPQFTADARLTVRGELVFDYTYTTDSHKRRNVPSQANTNTQRERAILFFGGSFAFGEGVNDEETLPNQLALLEPDTTMYNYAFSGYGPGQMLARLESYDVRADVPEATVAAVYTFIPNHVRRVIGAYSVINWSRHSPYYHFGGDGEVVRSGSFQGERAGLTQWYDFLQGDQVFQYYQLDFPIFLGKKEFQLTAAIIEAAAEEFTAQFASDDFYVLFYPETPSNEFDTRIMIPYLEKRGIRVLDYTALLTGKPEDYFFLPYDSHPRPTAHKVVAERLRGEALFRGVQTKP